MSGTNRNSFFIDSHSPALVGPVAMPGVPPEAVAAFTQFSPKERAILFGFSWLTRLATEPGKRDWLVACDQIQVAQNAGTILTLVLHGKGNFDQFKQGRIVSLGPNNLKLMTVRKHPHAWEGPILALYPSEALLNVIDAMEGVTDVMVVPWQAMDKDGPVAAWTSKWSALPIIPQTRTNES